MAARELNRMINRGEFGECVIPDQFDQEVAEHIRDELRGLDPDHSHGGEACSIAVALPRGLWFGTSDKGADKIAREGRSVLSNGDPVRTINYLDLPKMWVANGGNAEIAFESFRELFLQREWDANGYTLDRFVRGCEWVSHRLPKIRIAEHPLQVAPQAALGSQPEVQSMPVAPPDNWELLVSRNGLPYAPADQIFTEPQQRILDAALDAVVASSPDKPLPSHVHVHALADSDEALLVAVGREGRCSPVFAVVVREGSVLAVVGKKTKLAIPNTALGNESVATHALLKSFVNECLARLTQTRGARETVPATIVRSLQPATTTSHADQQSQGVTTSPSIAEEPLVHPPGDQVVVRRRDRSGRIGQAPEPLALTSPQAPAARQEPPLTPEIVVPSEVSQQLTPREALTQLINAVTDVLASVGPQGVATMHDKARRQLSNFLALASEAAASGDVTALAASTVEVVDAAHRVTALDELSISDVVVTLPDVLDEGVRSMRNIVDALDPPTGLTSDIRPMTLA